MSKQNELVTSGRQIPTWELRRNRSRAADERRRAALVVAGNARDADDCAELLAMLGIDPAEVRL